ncbi:unnamed protein product [Amoebophrya sp. A25]|nr:unnamed protein product [Amoebophrya sp. A25]|eukprot:GSA25T00010509001.1
MDESIYLPRRPYVPRGSHLNCSAENALFSHMNHANPYPKRPATADWFQPKAEGFEKKPKDSDVKAVAGASSSSSSGIGRGVGGMATSSRGAAVPASRIVVLDAGDAAELARYPPDPRKRGLSPGRKRRLETSGKLGKLPLGPPPSLAEGARVPAVPRTLGVPKSKVLAQYSTTKESATPARAVWGHDEKTRGHFIQYFPPDKEPFEPGVPRFHLTHGRVPRKEQHSTKAGQVKMKNKKSTSPVNSASGGDFAGNNAYNNMNVVVRRTSSSLIPSTSSATAPPQSQRGKKAEEIILPQEIEQHNMASVSEKLPARVTALQKRYAVAGKITRSSPSGVTDEPGTGEGDDNGEILEDHVDQDVVENVDNINNGSVGDGAEDFEEELDSDDENRDPARFFRKKTDLMPVHQPDGPRQGHADTGAYKGLGFDEKETKSAARERKKDRQELRTEQKTAAKAARRNTRQILGEIRQIDKGAGRFDLGARKKKAG